MSAVQQHQLRLEIAPYDLAAVLLVARNVVGPDKAVYKALTGHDWNPDVFAAQTLAYYGPAWVGVDQDGAPRFAGGFIQQRPGMYRTWFISDRSAWNYHLDDVTRIAREGIADMLTREDVHRVETWTLATHIKTRSWYGRIGLAQEATLHGFGASKEDVVIYVARKGGPT